jgi:hypothetical protein
MVGVLGRYSLQAAETSVFALLVVLSAGYLAFVTWMRWTASLVDFGAQIYRASRFANGEWLYRGAADWLRVHTSARDRVVVIPEGAMINYLSERKGGRFLNFMPPEVIYLGEEKLLAEFQANPPEWILVVPKNMAEWGVRLGENHLRKTLQWCNERYECEKVLHLPERQFRTYVYPLKSLSPVPSGSVE